MKDKTREGGGSYVIHAREGTNAPFDRSTLPHNVAGLTCPYIYCIHICILFLFFSFFNIRASRVGEAMIDPPVARHISSL